MPETGREKTVSRIQSVLRPAVVVLWAVACFCFFQADFKFHFYYIEQNQLFLNSSDYLSGFFQKPAWFSCMAGSFMQQFYHYILGGATVLTLSLLLPGYLGFRVFRIILGSSSHHGWREWTALLLSLVLMTAEARSFTYENALLATPYSLAGGLAVWLAYGNVHVRNVPLRILLFAALTVLCWWMFGYGAAVTVLAELLHCFRQKRIPVEGLASIVLSISLLGPVRTYYRMGAIDAVTFPGLGKWIDYDASRMVEKVLMYDNIYHRGDYRQIIGMYERASYRRTKEMSFYYTLSASQMGMLPDKLPLMKEPVLGTTVHLGNNASPTITRLMCELYYLIGDMTYAERVCMHANNFTPTKRSARLIKSLAMINLVTGDYRAADKYLRMLRKSFIYRKWAEDRTPGRMTEEVRREIEGKRPFINMENSVRTSDDCRMILRGLLDSNRGNVTALDYLLCTDWLTGQEKEFLNDYGTYGPRDKALYRHLLTGGNAR